METIRNLLMSDKPAERLRAMSAAGTLAAFEPSIAALNMDIPKGVHHKDNLEHSFKVLENAMSHETAGVDLVLRTAALFHDVGKPATRKFGGNKTVTFDTHEYVGAKMVRKILRAHGYTPAEIAEISLLVALHMRSHGFESGDWTDAGVRRLMTDAETPELFEKLVIIFFADCTTKHAGKRRAIHESVSALKVRADALRVLDARKALRPAVDGNTVMSVYGLTPGPELGKIMVALNSDEGVRLSEGEAHEFIKAHFSEVIVAAGGKVV